jgi:hypothetical protein
VKSTLVVEPRNAARGLPGTLTIDRPSPMIWTQAARSATAGRFDGDDVSRRH